MSKRSEIIGFRTSTSMAEKIFNVHAEVRRKCKRPYASSSKINRAFWMVTALNKNLRKRMVRAVCDLMATYDTDI